jgi:hypothetical protein
MGPDSERWAIPAVARSRETEEEIRQSLLKAGKVEFSP